MPRQFWYQVAVCKLLEGSVFWVIVCRDGVTRAGYVERFGSEGGNDI